MLFINSLLFYKYDCISLDQSTTICQLLSTGTVSTGRSFCNYTKEKLMNRLYGPSHVNSLKRLVYGLDA